MGSQDDYQGIWANALDKLTEEELWNLAKDHVNSQAAARKAELLNERLMLGADVDGVLKGGGDYDTIMKKVAFHGKKYNDAAWMYGANKKLLAAKSADEGLVKAVGELRSTNQEIMSLGPLARSSDENVKGLVDASHKNLVYLNQNKHNKLYTDNKKELDQTLQLLDMTANLKNKYDYKIDATEKSLIQKQIAETQNPNPWNIQLDSSLPEYAANQKMLMALQNKDVPAAKAAQYARPEMIAKAKGKKTTFQGLDYTYAGSANDPTFKTYLESDAGKLAIQNETLAKDPRNPKGKGYFNVSAPPGESPKVKEARVANEGIDKTVAMKIVNTKNTFKGDLLDDKFKNTMPWVAKSSYSAGTFKDPANRKILKNNVAQDLKVWFTSKTQQGDDAETKPAKWITKAINKAKNTERANARSEKRDFNFTAEDMMKAIRTSPEWPALIGKGGNAIEGYAGGSGLKEAFNWEGTGTSEDAGNAAFMSHLNLYLYLESIEGKKTNTTLDFLNLGDEKTVEEEEIKRMLEEIRKKKGKI